MTKIMELSVQVTGYAQKMTLISMKSQSPAEMKMIRKIHQMASITAIGTIAFPAPR
jgi:hypothetical protein